MKQFNSINLEKFITELSDVFIDSKLFGFECIGVTHDIPKNTLVLDMTGKLEDISIKLDLSKIGIEIGDHIFDEDGEGVFTPKIKIS